MINGSFPRLTIGMGPICFHFSLQEMTKMPNIATALKDEILRLARKEVRKELEGLKKASGQYRSDIAALKRQVAALEKQQARLDKRGPKKAAVEVEGEGTTRFRFSAPRFAKQRQKLDLSAADMGTLIGVSTQTIYHWESGKTRPRQNQLAAIAALRKMGKREIQAQLAHIQ
jgi:DNA-binding transcriptional regulator YiaG